MYKILTTSRFEKDLIRAKKRGKEMSALAVLLQLLENGERLPDKYKNHKLENVYPETWDCHIQPNWLLLYEIDKNRKLVKLKRTGTHADLFK
jgi:mRNA interferase YafQ